MAFVASAGPASEVCVVNLGPLALLKPLIDKLDIAAVIDRHLPSDAEISHGTVLAVLLAARLHSPTALVNVAEWAQQHGVEYLCNVPAEKLNDDRLARALDAFFEKRHDILADVTCNVLRLSGLDLARLHFDPTHVVLYGAYEGSVPRPQSTLDRFLSDIRMSPAHISRGYLTKYKMLQLGLLSVVDDLGPVPVAAHLFDGNRNGHTGIKEHYQLARRFLQLPEDLLLVSDRGTCSAEHCATLLDHGHHALCAGQWQDYSPLYDQHVDRLLWQKASYLSREQQRRRDQASALPQDDYHLAVVDHQLLRPDSKERFDVRVIFVRSSAAGREAAQRRATNVAKIKAGLEGLAQKLRRAHPTTTAASVTRAIARLLGKKSAARLFRWELVPLTAEEIAALPPPAKGYRKQSHHLRWTFDEAAAQAEERHDGVYALITTAPLTWSADALFTEYKRQTYVEREHHELKTPLAIAPIFLKTPQRVEALVSLLFLALQAYMTLERLYRQRVAPDAPPSERRRTAEKILRTFDVCGLYVEQHPYGELVHAARLSPQQRHILNQLSLPTPTEILHRQLAPPPT
jgi:transposase